MSCEETDEDIPPFLMEKAKMAGLQAVCAHREPLLCLADGVSVAKTVDEMFRSWFRAEKGPCEMMDAVGLDTFTVLRLFIRRSLG
ncbi:Dehydrogenase multihelical [Penicillium frequentans]|uniref:Dehydrogenase multihelical n=1 Tax=Penicillium frequentans TaxID=3151616 RepID=A0AAD6CWP5_9EURO|nr:Dehydrogenase multihelical [Penicillium glabrum]